MWFWPKKTIASASVKLPLSERRKRARILIIDDVQTAFPYKLLQKEGYNVTYWKNVANIRDLENGEYDIIVLDIAGIAEPEVSTTGGIGILTHIKKYNPAQIIIAYSGHKYDLRNAEFWKIADDYLGKPSSLLDCKEKIDALLEQKFTATYYGNVLRTILREQGVSEKKISQFEDLIVKNKDKPSRITEDTIARVTGIAKDAASIVGVVVTVILRLLPHSTIQ